MGHQRIGFWLLVWLGVAASLFSLANRWRVEAENIRVELALDAEDLRTVADLPSQVTESSTREKPLTPGEVLPLFRREGVTSLVVTEETIAELALRGEVQVTPLSARSHQLKCRTSALARRISQAIQTKLGVGVSRMRNGRTVRVEASYRTVNDLGVGLNPDTVSEAKRAGLQVVGRLLNWEGVRAEGIAATLTRVKAQGVETVLFGGRSVLGYGGYHWSPDPAENTTVRYLERGNLRLGVIEFSEQPGLEEMARALPERTIRVFTLSSEELLRLRQKSRQSLARSLPGSARDSFLNRLFPDRVRVSEEGKYVLAARERNVRLLYIRLFLLERGLLSSSLGYVRRIAASLRQEGLTTGKAEPYSELSVPAVLRLLMGVGVASAWLLLTDSLCRLLGYRRRWLTLLSWAVATVTVLLPLLGQTGATAAALLAALLFPLLALLHIRWETVPLAGPARPWGEIARFPLICGISLLGGLLIAGLLAEQAFLVKAATFRGVNIAEGVPLLAALLLFGILAKRPEQNQSGGNTGRAIGLALGGVAGAAVLTLAVLLLRSGNDSGLVADWELRLRDLLGFLFPVRPRFKEFLFGHPLLLAGLFLVGQERWRSAGFCLLGFAAVGQVSMVNTFCHLHTPLGISLLRTLIGMALGLVAGLVVAAVLHAALQSGQSTTRRELPATAVSEPLEPEDSLAT